MATDVDIKQLLEAGAHFGHQTSRWHPKMAQYIHSKRGGSHIIDLTKTVDKLDEALNFLADTAAKDRQILFVGTKRQAQPIVLALAENTKQPFVVNRWLGGMLTNWNTIGTQIKHLVDLEGKMASGELAAKFNKLEVQRFQEEIDSLNYLYGGIKELNAKPGAVVVFDVVHDTNAVKEAKKLGLPIVGIVDSNADPTGITYPIPMNDDAIKALQLVADYMQSAVETGKAKTKKVEAAKEEGEK
ncbi:MAG TPA: 30S ribosomal protein S2 [Candidatus Saccharimonadales bacterium]|jgi:small subunit ribosomal protein S2